MIKTDRFGTQLSLVIKVKDVLKDFKLCINEPSFGSFEKGYYTLATYATLTNSDDSKLEITDELKLQLYKLKEGTDELECLDFKVIYFIYNNEISRIELRHEQQTEDLFNGKKVEINSYETFNN